MRDAESALDQLIAFRGNEIREADVLAVFGIVSRHTLESLAEAVLQGDVAGIVRTMGELDAAGKDMQRLVLELLDYFRALLVFLCAPDAAGQEDLVASQLETLRRQAALANPERLLRIADILSQTEDRLRYALSRRTQVETALIRCARTTAVSIEELLRKVDALRKEAGMAFSGDSAGAVTPAPVRRPAAPAEPPPAAGPQARAAASVAAPLRKPEAPEDELQMLTAQWHEIIDRVGKSVSLAKGMLIDTRPTEVTESRIVIGFDPEFARNLERICGNPMYTRAIQGVLLQVLKRTVNVECKVLSEGADGRVDVPADHTVESAGSQSMSAKGAKSKQEWVKDPVVRKAMEIFNGGIVDIRE